MPRSSSRHPLAHCVLLLAVWAAPSLAQAHTRWVDPAPRSPDDGLTTGPCGGVARTDAPTTYPAGSTAEVRWEITQPHGGSFRIAFSPADDLGFDDNVLASFDEAELPLAAVATIELPACRCEACSLQLLQLTVSGNGGYHSCADIRLTGDVRMPACDVGGGSEGGETGAGSTGAGDGSGGSTGAAEDTSAAAPATTTGDVATSSGASGTNDAESGTGTPARDDADSAGGCGCATQPRVAALAWLLPPLLRRRRRAASRR